MKRFTAEYRQKLCLSVDHDQSRDHIQVSLRKNSTASADHAMLLSSDYESISSPIQTRKTLVLDLDEVIVHVNSFRFMSATHGTKVKIDGKLFNYYFVARPGLINFLESLKSIYDLCIFTCNELNYAETILSALGIQKYFANIYTKRHCVKVDSLLTKSLSEIGLSLSKTILIDDIDRHLEMQPLNGLKIKPFHGDAEDNELERLATFLKKLDGFRDVRPVSEKWEIFTQGKSLILDTQEPLTINEFSPMTPKKFLRHVQYRSKFSFRKRDDDQEDSEEEANVTIKDTIESNSLSIPQFKNNNSWKSKFKKTVVKTSHKTTILNQKSPIMVNFSPLSSSKKGSGFFPSN